MEFIPFNHLQHHQLSYTAKLSQKTKSNEINCPKEIIEDLVKPS